MKFKLTFIITGFLVLSLAAVWQLKPKLPSLTTQLKQVPDQQIMALKLGDWVLNVEVVNTPASITQGLSGRDELGADGMLFVLPRRQFPRFWMKEMKFNLDLVWIDGDTVIGITENVLAPDHETALSALPIYTPEDAVEMVLELPAGVAVAKQLMPGNHLSFP